MLLQFSVTNDRSIKENAIISMKAAADKIMKEILISPDVNFSVRHLYEGLGDLVNQKKN